MSYVHPPFTFFVQETLVVRKRVLDQLKILPVDLRLGNSRLEFLGEVFLAPRPILLAFFNQTLSGTLYFQVHLREQMPQEHGIFPQSPNSVPGTVQFGGFAALELILQRRYFFLEGADLSSELGIP